MVYSFTKLNDIKPAMVAEATKDARKAAAQFAQDSGTGVGGIKSATQGSFSIGARAGDDMGNGADSPYKKVRVVQPVDFSLDCAGGTMWPDRKSVGAGQGVSVRVNLGGRRHLN